MPAKIKFILNKPRNPKNIGASARGMANFGFRDLAVVNPYEVAWRETRAAVDAGAVVEKAVKFTTLRDAVRRAHVVIGTSAGSRRKETRRWIGLEELRTIVQTSAPAGKSVAIVFGPERSGLSNDELDFCHYVLKIPTARSCPSMNLAQAVAVVACAIRFEKKPVAPERGAPPAGVSVQHLEVLVKRALQASTRAGLQRGWGPRRGEDRMRKALYRWNLTGADVAMLHGLFGWVIKKSGD